MLPRYISPLSAILAAVFAVSVNPARAELLKDSPFAAPPGTEVVASAPGAMLEFRGVVTSDDGRKFSIFDPSKKSGAWVGLNERGFDFAVTNYDEGEETVTVEQRGRAMTLAMRRTKVASLGTAVAPMRAPIPVLPPMANPVVRAPIANPLSVTSTISVEKLRDDVMRRRALRTESVAEPPRKK